MAAARRTKVDPQVLSRRLFREPVRFRPASAELASAEAIDDDHIVSGRSVGWTKPLFVMLLLLLAPAACSSSSERSSAAPLLKVCGKTLSSSPNGPVLFDVAGRSIGLPYLTPGGRIYLRVAAGCEHGATFQIDPAGAASVAAEADARDHLPVAVVLQAAQARQYTVSVRQSDGAVSTAVVYAQSHGINQPD